MPQDIVLETAQAINDMRLSMSYSIGVTKMAMEAQETAAQTITQMMAPQSAPVIPLGQHIDTYA